MPSLGMGWRKVSSHSSCRRWLGSLQLSFSSTDEVTMIAQTRSRIAWVLCLAAALSSVSCKRAGRSQGTQSLGSSHRPMGKVASWAEIDRAIDSPESAKMATAWGYKSVSDMRRQFKKIRAAGFQPDPGGNGWIRSDGWRVDRNGVAWRPDGSRAGRSR